MRNIELGASPKSQLCYTAPIKKVDVGFGRAEIFDLCFSLSISWDLNLLNFELADRCMAWKFKTSKVVFFEK